MATQWPKCSDCKLMKAFRRNGASRGSCYCEHISAEKIFKRVYPKSPRMPGFIGFTEPWGDKPQIKTSPKWCPLRSKNVEG